jgi:SAM-dependent methyltransferase
VEYDLALFERLNDRYRQSPSVPKPPQRTRQDFEERAKSKLKKLTKYFDLSDKVGLELGTGNGWLAASLIRIGGAAAAIGIDVREYEDWENLRRFNPKLKLIVGDLSKERLVEPGSIDAVISTAVLEHVERPVQMLAAMHETLRMGGHAWLHFNLYRGRIASHKYRQVFFPWPHLLFEDEVCRAFYRKHHDRGQRFTWVNRLTAGDYIQICAEIGFEVTAIERETTPVENDIEFYVEFEDKLGRYPALDLETNFMTLVLKKADRASGEIPGVGYVERQRALDAALASFKAKRGEASMSALSTPSG